MNFEFEAIGTHWYIETTTIPDAAEDLRDAITSRIAEFEDAYSRFIPESIVGQIARSAGTYKMPSDFTALFKIYQQMYIHTAGAMTPLIGSALVQAGYDATYSLVSKPITSVPALPNVLSYTAPNLKVIQPVQLDFGAAGKGYLIDIVGEVLEAFGIKSYLIDAGGDIRARGPKSWRIGLENPSDVTEAIGVIELKNQSLCGSAGNRRAWGNYTHIINPHTKSSPTNIKGVWALAQNTLLADALTTALQFTSIDELHKHYKFDALILYTDGTISSSGKMQVVLF